MRISLESPNQPEVLQLIEELDAFQKPLYPQRVITESISLHCQNQMFFSL